MILSDDKDPSLDNLDELMTTNFGENWKPDLNIPESVPVLNPDLLKSKLLIKLEENNVIGYIFTKFMIGVRGREYALKDSLKVHWDQFLGIFKGKILSLVGKYNSIKSLLE